MAVHKWAIEHLAWPAMEKKKGNQIRKLQKELEKTQFASPQELEALQRQRLSRLLLH